MSIDSLTEKYKFNESDIDLSDHSSVELPTESDTKEPSKYLKTTETEAIALPGVPATEELFEDTETDKRKFFEALDQRSVDYKQLLDNLSDSDSEDVNTSELLRDVLGPNKDDEYSMSFESVTDLKEVKYDSKYENETDIMTGMSLVSEFADKSTAGVESVPQTMDAVPEYNTDPQIDLEKRLISDADMKGSLSKNETTIDGATFAANRDETAEKPQSIDQFPLKEHAREVEISEKPKVDVEVILDEDLETVLPTSANNPLVDVQNQTKVDLASPYLTFADLMKMNQDADAKKGSSKETSDNRSPERKRQPSPVRKAPQQHRTTPSRKNAPSSNGASSQVEPRVPLKPKATPKKKKELLQRASSKYSSKDAPVTPKSSGPITRIPNAPRLESASPLPESDESVKILETQLAQYQSEISRLMDELKKMGQENESIMEAKTSLETSLVARDQEIKTLQQQVGLLETALTNEKTSKPKSAGPFLSIEESEQIKKEIADQEYLIRGVDSANLVSDRK
jgi:hypothetical protein